MNDAEQSWSSVKTVHSTDSKVKPNAASMQLFQVLASLVEQPAEHSPVHSTRLPAEYSAVLS